VGKVKVKKKKVVKNKAAAGDEAAEGGKPAASKSEAEPFSRPGLFSKAKELQTLFSPLRDGEVNSEILRPRMQTESVEHGRGQGLLRGFTFRKFQDVPKAVVFMTAPSSKGGGAFELADRLLTVGEKVRLTYTTVVVESAGPVYFQAKGFSCASLSISRKTRRNQASIGLGRVRRLRENSQRMY